MHRGLPGGNTKLVLILLRPWALPTLGRVFTNSFLGLPHYLLSFTNNVLGYRFYMSVHEMSINAHAYVQIHRA